MFTDAPPPERLGWEARIVRPPYPNNLARSNRYYKLQPHAHLMADRVLYMDGRMRLNANPADVLAAFQDEAGADHDVFMPAHSLGHMAYDEPDWVLQKGITSPSVIREQVQRYEEAGMPRDLPACQAGVFIAKLNDRTREFFNAWWAEVERYSHRDQISFPYAWWSTNADVHLVPYKVARARFRLRAHALPQLEGAR
jgi:hypothetical protein